MARTYEYDEVVDGVTVHHVVTQTDATDSLIDTTKATDAALWANLTSAALSRQLTKAPPPAYVPPAPYAAMPDGSILTVGPGGQVYRDGRRLGTATVSRLACVGVSVYGYGLTDGKCWRWTGALWVDTPDVDPVLLNAGGTIPAWA